MSAQRYSVVARTLHWLIAFLILAQVAGGMYMHRLEPSATQFQIYQLHKSFGLVVLALSLYRLVWRLLHPVPALPSAMPHWEKFAARSAHWAFYALMIGVPMIGWLMVSADPLSEDVPLKLFFLIPLPLLPVPVSEGLAERFAGLHEFFAFATIFLLVVHVAAALKHHFVNRDNVLLSMAPGRSKDLTLSGLAWSVFAVLGVMGLSIAVIAFSGEEEEAADAPVAAIPSQNRVVVDNNVPRWLVNNEASRLEFVFTQNGRERVGTFDQFYAEIMLDPVAPETGQIEAHINMASADAGSSDRNTTLAGSSWFNTSEYAEAVFFSDTIAFVDNEYVADGTLTIKDIEQPVQLRFSLDITDNYAIADGVAELNRLDFDIEDEGVISNADLLPTVGVRVHIEAERQ